jgi:hypothetical protein
MQIQPRFSTYLQNSVSCRSVSCSLVETLTSIPEETRGSVDLQLSIPATLTEVVRNVRHKLASEYAHSRRFPKERIDLGSPAGVSQH